MITIWTDFIKHNFFGIQYVFLLAFVYLGFKIYGSENKSQFKTREADRINDFEALNSIKSKNETTSSKTPPLFLPGVRLQGAPHEILGVDKNASPEQIQIAYKELIKRYHPDKYIGQNPAEIAQAQKTAAILNEAKNTLLKK